jgi:hypothetical protein
LALLAGLADEDISSLTTLLPIPWFSPLLSAMPSAPLLTPSLLSFPIDSLELFAY